MDPNQNTPTLPPESQAAPAPQPSPSAPSPAPQVYTAEQVQAMVAEASKKAHDAANAEARRRYEGRTPSGASTPAPQQATQPTAASAAPATSLDIARVVMFTTEATKLGIPPKGVELLLSRLDAERPTDVSSWVAQQAADYGWKQPTTTTSTPTATPTAAQAVTQASTNTVPVTGNASPSNPTTVLTDDVPLWRRTEDQRQQFIREKGWPAYTARFTEESIRDGVRFRLPR